MMPLYTKNLLILLTSICLFFSSFYLLLPTLPLYIHYVGGDQKDVGLIIGIFTLSSVLFRPIAGRITDVSGRKMLLIAGALIFLISPFLYSSASTTDALIWVRIFHGLGIASFATSSITMVADMSPPHQRGEAFGAFGLAAMIALSCAPAGGTWLLTHFSFAAIFHTEAILAGASLFLCFFVKETFREHESQRKERSGRVFLPSAIIFLCTVTYGSIVAFLPFFAHDISDFGLYYTSYALSSILIRMPIGKISDKVGREPVILPGLFTLAVSLLLLSRSDTLTLLILSGFLYGLGFSSVYPTLTAMLVDRVPEATRARSLSYFTASFDLGIAAGSSIFGFIPLSLIYPLGSLIAFSGLLLFYSGERSSLSSSS